MTGARGGQRRISARATVGMLVALTCAATASTQTLRATAGPGAPHTSLRAASSCPVAPRGVLNTAPGRGRTVALTFDDGPGPSTPAILRILERSHVAATFFNLGVAERVRPALVRREARMGFALGNHTWDHPALPSLGITSQIREVERESAEVAAIRGARPCLFRPPYGSYDGTTLDVAASMHMAVWNWSVDTRDWEAQGSGSSSWVARIVSRATAGGSQRHPVILMHNQVVANPATVGALPAIIRYYRSRGYRFVDLYGREWTAPAPVLARTASGLHEYAVKSGELTTRLKVSGAGWSTWRGVGRHVVDVAAVADGPSAVLVAARAANGELQMRRMRDSAPSRWWTLGGSFAGRPAVARSVSGRVAVVVRGIDDDAWLRERVHGRWRAWQHLGGHLMRAPALAYTSADGLTVVGVDLRDRLVTRHRGDGSWTGWHGLGQSAASDPTLTPLPGPGWLALAVRTSRGDLRLGVWRHGFGWASWLDMPAVLASAPTVALDRAQLRVLGATPRGRTVENVWSGAGWTGWHRQR